MTEPYRKRGRENILLKDLFKDKWGGRQGSTENMKDRRMENKERQFVPNMTTKLYKQST